MIFVRGEEHKRNINLDERYYDMDTKHRINDKSDAGSQHDFDWDDVKFYIKKIKPLQKSKIGRKNSINFVSDLKVYNPSCDITLDQLI